MKTAKTSSNRLNKPAAFGNTYDIKSIQQRITKAVVIMNSSLIEREEEIAMILTAALCGEHSLLVGLPGTGKTMLMDSISKLFDIPEEEEFKILFSKFTTPEEVFGLIHPGKMMDRVNPQYIRHTLRMLPEARIALLDEVARGSSAILNTTLKIFNEGVYDKGDGVLRKCPLITAIGATNNWPGEGDQTHELNAFFDRLLFRREVLQINSSVGTDKLLSIPVVGEKKRSRNHMPNLTGCSISPDEVEAAKQFCKTIDFEKSAAKSFKNIIGRLAAEGIRPGDRRRYKAVDAAQAYAFVMGSDTVTNEHLEILSNVLWEDPKHRDKCNKVIIEIASPSGATIRSQLVLAQETYNTAMDSATKSAKLEAIKTELEAMNINDPRKDNAVKAVTALFRKSYFAATGIKDPAASSDSSDDDGPT